MKKQIKFWFLFSVIVGVVLIYSCKPSKQEGKVKIIEEHDSMVKIIQEQDSMIVIKSDSNK